MIKHLRKPPPPEGSTTYVPSQYKTITNGSSAEFTFTGRSGLHFGFSRIIPGSSGSLNSMTATAKLNTDKILFEDVKLSVLQSHFQQKELLFPYIIEPSNNLVITVTNSSGADEDIGIQLLGYDAPYLQKILNLYNDNDLTPPRPVFLHADKSITAGATALSVDVPIKAFELEMVRATVKTDSDSNIAFSLKVNNVAVKNKVFVSQFNDEYLDGYANVPFTVGANVPLSLTVDNLDGANAHGLSFLGECYVKQN